MRWFLLILMISSGISCSKEQQSTVPDSSKPYVKHSCTITGDLRLYSHAGAITDAGTLARWKQMLDDAGGFSANIILNTFHDFPGYFIDSVRFISQNLANMPRDYPQQSVPSQFTVERRNDSLILTDKNPVREELSSDPWNEPIWFQFGYRPIYVKDVPSNNPGYYFYNRTLQYFFAIRGDSLVMPMMAYAIKKDSLTSFISISNNNVPDLSGYSHLNATDSFACLTYEVSYRQ